MNLSQAVAVRGDKKNSLNLIFISFLFLSVILSPFKVWAVENCEAIESASDRRACQKSVVDNTQREVDAGTLDTSDCGKYGGDPSIARECNAARNQLQANEARERALKAAEENKNVSNPGSNALLDADSGLQGFSSQIGYGVRDGGLPRLIGGMIKGLLGLAGMVLVVLIIYAGWLWMSSQGEEDKIEKSKNILKSAIIGLVIILGAYAITTFIINAVIKTQ